MNKLKAFKIIGWFMLVVGVLSFPVPYDWELMTSTEEAQTYALMSLVGSIFWIGIGLILIFHVRKKERLKNELQK